MPKFKKPNQSGMSQWVCNLAVCNLCGASYLLSKPAHLEAQKGTIWRRFPWFQTLTQMKLLCLPLLTLKVDKCIQVARSNPEGYIDGLNQCKPLLYIGRTRLLPTTKLQTDVWWRMSGSFAINSFPAEQLVQQTKIGALASNLLLCWNAITAYQSDFFNMSFRKL